MKKRIKYKRLASKIVNCKIAKKAIVILILADSNMYLFFSGVFVSIAGSVVLESINLEYIFENRVYIILHFILIALSLVATLILAYIADLTQKIDISIAKEYSRLTFNTNAAEDKKNQFENSLKDAYNISEDVDNKHLSRALCFTYAIRAICFVIAPICVALIVALAIINHCIGGVFI